MLLFNLFAKSVQLPSYAISIHLMLLFNVHVESPKLSLMKISIHLMLLFNQEQFYVMVLETNFNTSNVTIQQY